MRDDDDDRWKMMKMRDEIGSTVLKFKNRCENVLKNVISDKDGGWKWGWLRWWRLIMMIDERWEVRNER